MALAVAVKDWVRDRIKKEAGWYHKIELAPDLVTPGWDDPRSNKLPYFGLPADMRGMRVLDIGCCEGFFSFEAERRGAREVVAIDAWPENLNRFILCRDALGSKITPYLCNVYDLNPKNFGTFDMVFFFGVLYHLRHQLLALEKIRSICTGTILLQTITLHDMNDAKMRELLNDPVLGKMPLAKLYPLGVPVGRDKEVSTLEGPEYNDTTMSSLLNREGVKALLHLAGFKNIQDVSVFPNPSVWRAEVPQKSRGQGIDLSQAPYS